MKHTSRQSLSAKSVERAASLPSAPASEAADVPAATPVAAAEPFSPLANPRATRRVLEQHGLYAKHRLGQNFLVDDAVIGKILALAQPCAHTSLLEVGPGIGTLSLALLQQHCQLIAIEKDDDLLDVLASTCALYANAMHVYHSDALRVDAASLQAFCKARNIPQPAALVANLPYQIAATLVLQYFEDMPQLERMTVMVQSEVACRMAAKPHDKLYGAYSAKLALYAAPAGSFVVKPSSFMPAPHVTSQVIALQRHAPADLVCDGELRRRVCVLIDAAFAQRRKTLVNCLSAAGIAPDITRACLCDMQLAPAIRAEVLHATQFVELYTHLQTHGALEAFSLGGRALKE